MTIVVDTSVILAVLQGERGAEDGERLARGGVIGTANLVEAVSRGEMYGHPTEKTLLQIAAWGLEIAPVDRASANEAMALWPYRKQNLSLGDRLCIGLARARGLPVLTGDRAWSTMPLGVEVRLFR